MARYHKLPYRTVAFDIPYTDKPPYRETATRDGTVATRTLMCNWSDARVFPTAILGTVAKGTGALKRVLPEPHPHHSKNMWAVTCNLVNGHGAWKPGIDYGLIWFEDMINELEGMAEWEVSYAQMPYDVLPDGSGIELGRFVSRIVDTGTDTYTMPGTSFYFATPNPNTGKFILVPEPVPHPRLTAQLAYTWHWVPEPLNPDIPRILGRINSLPFDGVGGNPTYEAQSILFHDYEVSERKWTPDGKACRDITFLFAYRQTPEGGANSRHAMGWNAHWNATLGRFDLMVFSKKPFDIGPFIQYQLHDLFIP